MSLPKIGRDKNEILAEMDRFGMQDARYKDGKTWSLVYYLGEEHTEFLKKAYGMFFSENGLNPMAFSSLKRFESEIIRTVADLMHGDGETVGVVTSGGTESCLLAVKTYRDMARKKWPWIRNPEMIVPETIHVAFEKAAEYFNVKAVHAPLTKDHRVDVRAVKRRINRNTILLVGSAPCYPFGVVDPFEDLGRLAQRKNLPLHVDACLGGFFLPFVEKLGHPIPPFDFRIPGVTSIGADIHKYGYSAKGASTLIYRNMEIMKHQMFVFDSWPGGIFASPALLGTRPGGAYAAAWAALQAIGEQGYLDIARETMGVTRKLIDGINAIPELRVLGQPDMSVFAYQSVSDAVNIYAVGDQMTARGWHIDRQQKPEALHAMVTPRHATVADQYLQDLKESVEIVKADPELATKGNAAMYGMIAHIPLRGMIRDNVLKMMMAMYSHDGQLPDLEAQGQSDDLATQAGLAFLKAKKAVQKKIKDLF